MEFRRDEYFKYLDVIGIQVLNYFFSIMDDFGQYYGFEGWKGSVVNGENRKGVSFVVSQFSIGFQG